MTFFYPLCIMIRKRTITRWILLLGGLYAAGTALWRLGASAVFVHEAVVLPGVVVDVRERPFEDFWEAMTHGNLPWEGAVAHQPYVRYEFAGLSRVDDSLPDLDNRDYDRGQQVEVILHPQKPHERHLNKAKFIWGCHLMQLGLGLLMLLLWRIVRPRRRVSVVKQAARRVRDKVAHAAAEAVAEKALPTPKKSAARAEPTQLALDLVETVAEAAPKKRRRSTKPKDPNAPPRTRKKKDPDAPPKKRTRKKPALP